MVMVSPALPVPLIVGVVAALRLNNAARGLRWNALGLVLSTAYLAWSVFAQGHIDQVARASLRTQGIAAERVLVTPAPLQTLLWRVVALPDDPASDVGSSSDPQVAESVSDRLEKAAHESAGESMLDESGSAPKCRTMRGTILGTGETPLGAGVYCPTTGWSRTQFQLSAPPRN